MLSALHNRTVWVHLNDGLWLFISPRCGLFRPPLTVAAAEQLLFFGDFHGRRVAPSGHLEYKLVLRTTWIERLLEEDKVFFEDDSLRVRSN